MEPAREVLEAEYLPLPIAALVAYYRITDIRRQVPQNQIGETVRVMAVALSTVATIYGPTCSAASRRSRPQAGCGMRSNEAYSGTARGGFSLEPLAPNGRARSASSTLGSIGLR